MSVSSMLELRARVWDPAASSLAGVEKRTLRGHSERVNCCAFSPDGKSLVSGAGKPAWEGVSSDNTLKIWDAGTGACNYTLRGHTSAVVCCAFSPDGKSVLSGSCDYTLKIWSASDGSERYTLSGHSSYVNACCFSPDGGSVLSGSATLKIWDAATGARLRSAFRPRLIS